jgi:hypothetical protein
VAPDALKIREEISASASRLKLFNSPRQRSLSASRIVEIKLAAREGSEPRLGDELRDPMDS